MCDLQCPECKAAPCECVPSEIAEIEREYLPKAENTELYGYQIRKLNRYELMAIVAWLAEKHVNMLMEHRP